VAAAAGPGDQQPLLAADEVPRQRGICHLRHQTSTPAAAGGPWAERHVSVVVHLSIPELRSAGGAAGAQPGGKRGLGHAWRHGFRTQRNRAALCAMVATPRPVPSRDHRPCSGAAASQMMPPEATPSITSHDRSASAATSYAAFPYPTTSPNSFTAQLKQDSRCVSGRVALTAALPGVQCGGKEGPCGRSRCRAFEARRTHESVVEWLCPLLLQKALHARLRRPSKAKHCRATQRRRSCHRARQHDGNETKYGPRRCDSDVPQGPARFHPRAR